MTFSERGGTQVEFKFTSSIIFARRGRRLLLNGGEPILAKVFDTLLYLVTVAVIEKDELMSSIWPVTSSKKT
jgi:hypothetical protein